MTMAGMWETLVYSTAPKQRGLRRRSRRSDRASSRVYSTAPKQRGFLYEIGPEDTEALSLEVIAGYNRRATGEKYLIAPHKTE